jgi:dGTPase
VRREDLPDFAAQRLGRTNGVIIYTLVSDLITHSFDKNYVGYSPEVGRALKELKQFNYDRIYNNPRIKEETSKIAALFAEMFSRFLEDIRHRRLTSPIWRDFLSSMDRAYLDRHQPGEMVRDYLASMTDAQFLRRSQEMFFPQALPARFA